MSRNCRLSYAQAIDILLPILDEAHRSRRGGAAIVAAEAVQAVTVEVTVAE